MTVTREKIRNILIKFNPVYGYDTTIDKLIQLIRTKEIAKPYPSIKKKNKVNRTKKKGQKL